jgi:hypothetical protein
MDDQQPQELEIEQGHVILIVVGACLRAEIADRPLAYRLQRRVRRWLRRHDQALNVPIEPVVCTEVWYLNSEELQQQPTVSIGGPGVNALSAFFADQLEEEPDQEQAIIQIDPEFTDLRVCIWGVDHEMTTNGLDVFLEQYLDRYLRAVATQVEPEEGE